MRTSPLLFWKEFSSLLYKVIKSGTNSKGVIASRYYRRPVVVEPNRAVIDIRPFNEIQIAKAIRKTSSSVQSEEVIKTLFDSKPDLGVSARNPFILSLIMRFYYRHKKFPGAQTELYEDFITESLDSASESLQEYEISPDEVRSTMQVIAGAMFNSERFGLEMPVSLLKQRLPNHRIEDVVEILRSAKLIRVGSPKRTVSFVHRRFNEYFLVQRFVASPGDAPLESIPQKTLIAGCNGSVR